jgi:nucleotide-binding universal stress UspA family protein
MIRAILFPTDFSAVANSAFPIALAVAAQYDAIVQSIHIAHGGDPHITETSRYEFPAAPTGSSAVRVIETIVPKDSDDPAQVIMKQAELRTCDLIVMASHGRSDVAQFFLGRSVAEQVARDSKVPTIIARLYGPRRTTRPIDRFKKILFVTDLAEDSKRILPIAASLATKTKAKLETLCVFNEVMKNRRTRANRFSIGSFPRWNAPVKTSSVCMAASAKKSSNMQAVTKRT